MEFNLEKDLTELSKKFNILSDHDINDIKQTRTNNIFIDTNSLLIPSYFDFDIFSRLKENYGLKTRFIVLDIVLYELNKILNEEKIRLKDFKLVLNILEHNKENIFFYETNTNTKTLINIDDLILEKILDIKLKNKYLLTNDSNFRKKSYSKKLKVIFINNKQQIKEY